MNEITPKAETVKAKQARERARRHGIKRIEERINQGLKVGYSVEAIKTPQGEPLIVIKARLIRHYEANFGPYTGKAPR